MATLWSGDWSNPPWLTSLQFTAKQLSTLLHEHIDERGHLRSSIWYDQPGIGMAGKSRGYIEQVFHWAHAADPKALLFYNDGGGETLNPKSDAMYAIVQDFKRRGVPIDGVSLRMHVDDLNVDFDGIAANIARFTALGVQVHITELDVALPTDSNGNVRNPADLTRQAGIYRRIAQACFAHPGCTAIQTWGFTDKYSWIRSRSKGTKGAALLFDRNYAPKPSYAALKEGIATRKPTVFALAHDASDTCSAVPTTPCK